MTCAYGAVKPPSGASCASQLKLKTSPSSSGLPTATWSKDSGSGKGGAHQEQVPELRMPVRVAFDAGFAVAVHGAERFQRTGVVDARFLQQLAAHRVLGRLAGFDGALGQLHVPVAGVVEDEQAAPRIDQAGARLEDRALRHRTGSAIRAAVRATIGTTGRRSMLSRLQARP